MAAIGCRRAKLLGSAVSVSVSVFGFASLCVPQVAWAQAAETAQGGYVQPDAVEDIIVTAQKKNRAERLQDIPVSVTALGSAQLERTHFQNLTDIAIRAPGVSLGAYGRARGYASSNRSEEHTPELQSLMRISYAGFCLKKKKTA